MTEKIYLKIGRPKMNHFKLLLLLFTVLNAACNNQNVKSNANMQTNIAELQQIADTAYNNERWEDVINYYTKLTNQTPNDAKIWYRIGNAYAHLNQTKSAIDAYQNALLISPNNSMILHNMGITQLKESTKTFLTVKKYTDDNDPLNIRAQLVINAISILLYKEFKIEIEN
jgi:tetratricopeptide (TPR) repeat protein